MGRNSGGNNDSAPDSWSNDDTSYRGPIKNRRSLVTMQDPQMYKATKQAISNFYSKTGAIERNVKVADMEPSVMGIGSKGSVYLNGVYFDRKDSKKFIDKEIRRQYKQGWQTKTNNPVAHVITHELSHTVWTRDLKEPKHIAAGKEIKKMAREWLKDKKKQGYGKYSKSNVDEFWAEVVTKAVHGTPDKYTKRAIQIIKKYKL